MSDLAKTCDEILACTKATLALIQGDDPQLNDISLRVQKRSSLFSKLHAQDHQSRSPEDVRLLTQLAKTLQPIDTKILAWMQEHHTSVKGTLRKVHQEVQGKRRIPSEARILIQDA